MEIKEKTCRECGAKFKPYTTTQKCCSRKCTFDHEKKRKEHKEAQRIEAQGQSRKQLFQTARTVFNGYIREKAIKDGIKECFCCGEKLGKDFQCGHVFSGGAHTNVIFNEDNVRPQNFECNNYKAGNVPQFMERLEKEIGSDSFNVLREEAYKTKSYSIDELLRIIRHYKSQLKALKNEI